MAGTATMERPADTKAAPVDQDVLIVGAGISGIGMAVHLQMNCPDRSFALVERREQLGGTWDLFRYPGIRSDSDMHTLGFVFEPWRHEKSIADGPSILDYLNRIVDERGIRQNIRFGAKVQAADWHGGDGCWHLSMAGVDGKTSTLRARWLYLGSGYYDYDSPYEAPITGKADFAGQIIHPQFWPKNLDYSGKRVVVIGSGATAVTIVPSLAAGGAAHVTMLQRTPTWYATRPAKDGIANFLRRILPDKMAYAVTRTKNVVMQDIIFKRARKRPDKVAAFLTKKTQAALGEKYVAADFTPPYAPWDQRLCLVPDSDLFNAIRADKADVVTATIDKIDASGIQLNDGRHQDADIIVTATGLSLAVAGKIALSMDGVPITLADHFYYKGAMFSNIPNFSAVFGYLNASWTLRADLISEYVCKVLNHMDAVGANVATPALADDHGMEEDDIFDFSSGYIQRGRHLMPRNAHHLPWRLNQDYRQDKADLARLPVADGVITFTHVGTGAANDSVPPEAIAAE